MDGQSAEIKKNLDFVGKDTQVDYESLMLYLDHVQQRVLEVMLSVKRAISTQEILEWYLVEYVRMVGLDVSLNYDIFQSPPINKIKEYLKKKGLSIMSFRKINRVLRSLESYNLIITKPSYDKKTKHYWVVNPKFFKLYQNYLDKQLKGSQKFDEEAEESIYKEKKRKLDIQKLKLEIKQKKKGDSK